MTKYKCPECDLGLIEVKPEEKTVHLHQETKTPISKYFFCKSGKHKFNRLFQEPVLKGLECKLVEGFSGQVISLDYKEEIVKLIIFDQNNINYDFQTTFSKFSFECKEGDFFFI